VSNTCYEIDIYCHGKLRLGIIGWKINEVLLSVSSRTWMPVFIEISLYLADTGQKISWHVFWDMVYKMWWVTQQRLYGRFLIESNSDRILKIGQHLPKLCLRLEWHVFWFTLYNCGGTGELVSVSVVSNTKNWLEKTWLKVMNSC